MKRTSALIVALMIYGLVSAQIGKGWISKKSYTEAADKALLEKDYFNALTFYLEALEYDTLDINVLERAAEVARKTDSYKLALNLYQKVIDLDTTDTFGKSLFWKASLLQQMGRYQEAKDQYLAYYTEYEDLDALFTKRARKEISSCEWALNLIDRSPVNVQLRHLGDSINTPDSEFGGVMEENGLTFSSLRYYYSKDFSPIKPYSKVYKYDGVYQAAEYGELNSPEKLHTAHTAYNDRRTEIYYTLCAYKEGSVDITCDIYKRKINADGTLGDTIRLASPINLDGYTSTQPNVGYDLDLGIERLYFVSDRPYGTNLSNFNIWSAEITKNGEYGEPVFLDALNTLEDDITPFFHKESQTLYFSSQGYTSFGGFDIYKTSFNNGRYITPENLGSPINSSFNDIYYFLGKEGNEGLLSSNRDTSGNIMQDMKSKYLVDETGSCCYDIYEVNIDDIELQALTFDSKTLAGLAGVTVRLFDSRTGELIATVTNDLSNEHVFILQHGRDYTLISTKDKYLPDTTTLNANSLNQSEIIRRIYLKKNVLELQAFTFDKISNLPLFGTTVTLVDLTDPTIAPRTLTNEGGNNFNFEVITGHEYRVTGSKDRYFDDEVVFVAEDLGSDQPIIQRLFLDRKDLNIYLPLSVYFDNDLPEQKTLALNTSKTYSETFDEYALKKQEFKDKYAAGLSGAQKEAAEKEIDDFFLKLVNGGYDQLQSFLSAMLTQLQSGKSFDLSIRGYASPRADSRYNLALGQRRVRALRNEINAFENGVFKSYQDNGQLKITELSYGENLAPENVSDKFNDLRNSVYSPLASRERRAQIVEIKTQNLNNN